MKYGSYNNKKVECDGYSFASKLEASVYSILKNKENIGEITDLKCQEQVNVCCNDKDCPHDKKVIYKPDFSFTEVSSGEKAFAEAKGFASEVWPLKKRLWKHYGKGRLDIYMGSHTRPFLKEIIIPKVEE